jgi:hypothetical protein
MKSEENINLARTVFVAGMSYNQSMAIHDLLTLEQ